MYVYMYMYMWIYIYIYVVSLELWNPGISTRTTSCQNKTGHGFHKSHPLILNTPQKSQVEGGFPHIWHHGMGVII